MVEYGWVYDPRYGYPVWREKVSSTELIRKEPYVPPEEEPRPPAKWPELQARFKS